MTNLRNPDLRARDMRKLVSYKSQEIVWDEGCDSSSEWVFASLESEAHIESLLNWLISKGVNSSCEFILVDSGWSKLKKLTWGDLLTNPAMYFGKDSFKLYDIDLNWVLEYEPQEVVRFGTIGLNQNA